MLFRPATLDGIAAGSVTLAFRRWDRPRVRPGGSQRTAIGVVEFDTVEPVERTTITDADARAAGFESRAALLAMVDRRDGETVYRVRLHLAGADPRIDLRDSIPDADELRQVAQRLARLDRASRHGPWTQRALGAIAAAPGVRAADLATQLNRERLPFKIDVRKLKELGLTESLPRGYRLSPRGQAVLASLAGGRDPR